MEEMLLLFEDSDPAWAMGCGLSRERCVSIGCSGPAHPSVRHGLTGVDEVYLQTTCLVKVRSEL